MAKLELSLFGYPRVTFDGQSIRVDTRKAIALLAYLVVSGEAPSRDALAALLWPDYDQTSARGALRRTLSVLNKATGSAMLEIERERVGLARNADVQSDVRAFEQALQRAEAMRPPAGIPSRAYLEALGAAAGLYRERFLAGFSLRDAPEFDEWQYLQAEQYAQQYVTALERLARGYAASGDYPAALEAARRWLAQDALIEEAHRLTMQLYAQNGQRGAALRQYRECVRTLEQELGVEPLAETTMLYHAILENRLEAPLLVEENPPQSAPGAHPASYPLVGRAAELRALQQIYQSAGQGGQYVLIEGEAGIGKSRLVDEFLGWAAVNAAVILSLRSFEGESGLAYAPFASGLLAAAQRPAMRARLDALPPAVRVELARLAPGLFGGAHPSSEAEQGGSSRFLESIRQALTTLLESNHPGVLWLDDLQWADAATLDLMAYLLRRLPANQIMVLTSWRSDVPASPALLQIIYDAQRVGIFHRMRLDRLRPEDVNRLAENALPDAPDRPLVAERLLRETEGLPFFLVEYLELLRQQNLLSGEQAGAAWSLPVGVRDVLRQRVSGVDNAAQQLLGAGAVIGRSFDFSTLREVSGRSELETIAGLEQLTARGLIVENDSGSDNGEIVYDFRHEKLRDLMYEDTSLARRRLLHRRVAETLARPGGRLGGSGSAALVAHHYQLAGMTEQAAVLFSDAGDQARAVYANADAAAHYRAALALGHPSPAGLHEAIGDVETLRGEYRGAISSYENAAAFQQGCLAAIEHKLGAVHARMGALERAERHYQAAMEALDAECPASLAASILADWSYAAYRQGQAEQAEALAQQALATAQHTADALTQAQAHNTLGMLARSRGETSAAQAHLLDSLRVAGALGSAQVEIAALNNLARLYAEMDQMEKAIETGRRALHRCRQLGDRHREAAILNNLADLLHAHGQHDAAMQYLKQAVTIFAEIGMEGGGMEPEIWKLSEW